MYLDFNFPAIFTQRIVFEKNRKMEKLFFMIVFLEVV